jgi:hypothetical protein
MPDGLSFPEQNVVLAIDPCSILWNQFGAGGAGGHVAIFEGGHVPFTIRPKGQNWEVFGPCHVYGCTQGQSL